MNSARMCNLLPLVLRFATAQEKKNDFKIDHRDDFDVIVVKVVMIASNIFINTATWKRNSGRAPIKAKKLK